MVREAVNADLKAVLAPIADQISKLGSGVTGDSTSLVKELNDLKEKQKHLGIEAKLQSLNTPVAQSQYRCVSNIHSKLESALVKLDDLMLSQDSPDDPLYQALSIIREDVADASNLSSERIDLIFKADLDPRHGWQVLTMYEE
jgi:hypothetical protein